MIIKDFMDKSPKIHNAWIADDVDIIGDVEIGEDASIWYGTVIRGDVDGIIIGKNTCVEDNCTIHNAIGIKTVLSDNVVVGHNVVMHSCFVEENCLLGMNSILLDGCYIGKGSIIGAGSVVTPGTKIPPNSMVMGTPGRVVRETTEKERQNTWAIIDHYKLKHAPFGNLEKITRE